MAAAAYESDDTGAASSSDESADIDFHGIKRTVFKGNMAAVEREIEELEKVCVTMSVRAYAYDCVKPFSADSAYFRIHAQEL
jgi:hypothetical protein